MSKDMTFEDVAARGYYFTPIDDGIEELPPHIDGICPKCPGNRKLKYIHDLRCEKCDNQYVQYCDMCEGHYRIVKLNK